MTAASMTAWAIEALLASAALIALVLALRLPVRRAFGPQVAYALWALPALRLMLPPLPESWTRVAPAPLADAGARLAFLILPAPLPEAAPSLLGPALVLLWGAGAAAFLLWQLGSYLRFVRRVAASGTMLGRVGRIALVVSEHVPGPLAYGLARPVVAVPRDFRARYDAAERELALRHEVGHHRRGDVFANWIALGVLALHWFNPLAWIAFRAFRVDQEMANDASVLAGRDPAERYAYACALVRAGAGRVPADAGGGKVPAGACELHTIDDLKGRLRMLAATTSRGRRAAGAALIAGATLTLLGLTASGSSAAESVRATVESATGVPLAALAPTALLQDTPDGPRPPAPPGPTGPGSGGRHVEATRTGKAVHVTVTENGRTRHYSGAEAEAWLAANPVPTPPAPPAPPVPGARPGPPTPPAPHGPVPPHPPAPAVPPISRIPPMPPMPSVPPTAWQGPDTARMPQPVIPQFVSRDCRRGENGTLSADAMTVTRVDGGKRVIVICDNRVEAMAKRAEVAALDPRQRGIARAAMANALASLRSTRAMLASGRGLEQLTREQRAEAMADIDSSIAEVEREAADAD